MSKKYLKKNQFTVDTFNDIGCVLIEIDNATKEEREALNIVTWLLGQARNEISIITRDIT